MENIELVKGPNRGVLESMKQEDKVTLFSKILSYYRWKEYRKISKFFWIIYDNLNITHNQVEKPLNDMNVRDWYIKLRDCILDRSVNSKNYHAKLDQELWRYSSNILSLKRSLKIINNPSGK